MKLKQFPFSKSLKDLVESHKRKKRLVLISLEIVSAGSDS